MTTNVGLTFFQNSTFAQLLHRARDKFGQPVDLSERTARCAFKINYTAPVAFELPVALTERGEVFVSGSIEDTDVKAGRYVYDIVLDNGDRIVSGLATVNPAVSAFF